MNDTISGETLRASLASLQPWPVADDSGIGRLLGECWDQFSGSEAEGMSAYKLGGRMEQFRWDPPVLTFEIERHGATVRGSSRAELHTWEIDVVNMTANCRRGGFRQLTPMSPRLNVKPIAEDVATVIPSGQADLIPPDRTKRLSR